MTIKVTVEGENMGKRARKKNRKPRSAEQHVVNASQIAPVQLLDQPSSPQPPLSASSLQISRSDEGEEMHDDPTSVMVSSESRNRGLKFISNAVRRIRSASSLDREQLFGVWDYLIISLSIASMFMIFMQLNRDLSPELNKLLRLFDWITCAFFFVDFLLRLMMASSKRAYLRWGWIDLVSSIPTLEAFRWGRAFRLVRIVRAIRGAVRGTQKIKMSDPFLSAVIIYLLCVFLGAASVLYLEAEVPNSNIKSARDAIWWAMVTVTTVGYGDFTPVTNEGRILAVVLMSSGIGLFGVFSVQCTQYLLKRWHDDEDQKVDEIHRELLEVRRELKQVRDLLERFTLPSPQAEVHLDEQAEPLSQTPTSLAGDPPAD